MWFIKKILFEYKKKKLRGKWHLVENKRYHTPCLKKGVNFLVAKIHIMNFQAYLPA
jgi:hypothetical protein